MILCREKTVCMKKIMIAVAACLVLSHPLHAQSWSEWFQQKKTQKKYLLQQIAALQVYIDYAAKGYKIAGDGIHAVRDIKKGDFNLHENFFKSLYQINPAIKKYGKVADILLYQYKILKGAKQTLRDAASAKQLSPEETDYCKSVFDFLFGECVKSVDELLDVLTADNLQMKDDERLKRIDAIYADMQDKYTFCASFSEDLGLLNAQRIREQAEMARSTTINAIK